MPAAASRPARFRRAARMALLSGAALAACGHDWDPLDPRLAPPDAGGPASVAASGSGGAGGAASSAGPGGAAIGGAGTGGTPDPCGNGIIDVAEECDDANSDPTDGCDACQVPCDGVSEFEDPATHACYALLPGSTWAAGVDACKAWGGHLATVTSQPELDFVRTFVTNNVWIGGNAIAQEDVWIWDDGEPWSFAPWNAGEPNNAGGLDAGVDEDCLELYHVPANQDPVGFADDTCTHVQPPVCERDPAGTP
jgi:cysteine-rich repeat protein